MGGNVQQAKNVRRLCVVTAWSLLLRRVMMGTLSAGMAALMHKGSHRVESNSGGNAKEAPQQLLLSATPPVVMAEKLVKRNAMMGTTRATTAVLLTVRSRHRMRVPREARRVSVLCTSQLRRPQRLLQLPL
jgi:hypothetical protein